jgi:hypothetical protein
MLLAMCCQEEKPGLIGMNKHAGVHETVELQWGIE